MKNKENTDDKIEFIKKAVKVGNSAGVLLPKKFLGSEIKIIVIKKPLDIKKDALSILEDYFPDLLGIYLTNISKNLIEILAVSSDIKEIIHLGNYKISIVPLNLVKRDLKINPRLRAMLNQSKVILNKNLLFELKKINNQKLV